jgi:hypothetical protein
MMCKSCVLSLKHLNVLHLHLYCCRTYLFIYIHIYTFMTMCKCFGVCKCKEIYYLPFMTIVSLKSMFISCGCIPKLFFFFLQWATLIGPSQKIMILWYCPNIKAFSTNMGLWWCYFKKYFECKFCRASLLEYNFYYYYFYE